MGIASQLGGSARGDDDARADVAVVVVAFEAATTIEQVLTRIPEEIGGRPPTVLVADDASTDDTVERADRWASLRPPGVAIVVRREHNLGYGGNQKAGYGWALGSGAAIVVLLHGDAQYQPEQIPALIAPIVAGSADAVLGSRMSEPGAARRGGMPLGRRLGNRALSTIQNRLAGTDFTEWHTGLRAYRTSTLARVDLSTLPDGFDFDTALMLRLLELGAPIAEIPIPTRYADEKSRVQLVRFGLQVLRRTAVHRWHRSGPAVPR